MSENEQDKPIMDGADDATNEEKLQGLIEQVEHDHGGEGDEAKAGHLRDRLDETGVEAEEPGDSDS